MTSDFRLVSYATERDAVKLATHRRRQTPRDTSLADTRRSDEEQDWSLVSTRRWYRVARWRRTRRRRKLTFFNGARRTKGRDGEVVGERAGGIVLEAVERIEVELLVGLIFDLLAKAEDGEIFEQSLLDLDEAEMIVV